MSLYHKTKRAAAERALDAKIEKHFSGHRELPNGRNFMHFNKEFSAESNRKFRHNFDNVFPNSPGAGF